MEDLGRKLRQLRQSKGMRIVSLADSIGVSKSLISQIERGEVVPSLLTLRKLSKGLNVSITEFFNDGNMAANNERDIVVKQQDRKRLFIPGAKAKYELLTPNLQRKIEFLLIEVEPNTEQDEIISLSHEGEECSLVLEGELVVKIGEKEHNLTKGDSISFDSGIQHSVENRTNQKAIIVTAISPPNF